MRKRCTRQATATEQAAKIASLRPQMHIPQSPHGGFSHCEATFEDPEIEAATRVYRLRGVVAPTLCRRIVGLVQTSGLLSRSQHLAANTVEQVSVNCIPELMLILHTLHSGVLQPLFRDLYGVNLQDQWLDATNKDQFKLVCNDCFVSRYAAQTEFAGIALHRDAEDYGFVIQLNEPREFDGGGTAYPNHVEIDAAPLGQGDMGAHPGYVLHGGNNVTRGVRYILAGFLKVQEDTIHGHQVHPSRTVDRKAMRIETSGWLLAKTDIALAKLFLGKA